MHIIYNLIGACEEKVHIERANIPVIQPWKRVCMLIGISLSSACDIQKQSDKQDNPNFFSLEKKQKQKTTKRINMDSLIISKR